MVKCETLLPAFSTIYELENMHYEIKTNRTNKNKKKRKEKLFSLTPIFHFTLFVIELHSIFFCVKYNHAITLSMNHLSLGNFLPSITVKSFCEKYDSKRLYCRSCFLRWIIIKQFCHWLCIFQKHSLSVLFLFLNYFNKNCLYKIRFMMKLTYKKVHHNDKKWSICMSFED